MNTQNTIKIEEQIEQYKEEVTELNFLTLSSKLIQEWEALFSDNGTPAFTEDDLFVAYDFFSNMDDYNSENRLNLIINTTIGYGNACINLLKQEV